MVVVTGAGRALLSLVLLLLGHFLVERCGPTMTSVRSFALPILLSVLAMFALLSL